jgi:predicted permease
MVRIDLPPQAPSLSLHLAPDGRVLAFAVVLMGVTGAIFGLVPAVRLSRPELVPALKTGSAGSTGGEGRTRSLFVIGQVALAVTLLLTGALFARSLQKGLQADLGFDPGGVVAANIDLAPPLDYDEERGRAFRRTLLERVRARPGVEQAAWSLYVLASGSSSSGDVRRADAPELPSVNASYTVVTPDYFETMRIELEAGRGFTRGDIERAPLVAVINRTLAERLFPGENPLGRSLEGFGAGPSEIVGVTAAGRYALITEQPRAFVFLPYEQVYRSSMALHVRAGGEAAATLRAVAEEVRALDADVALGLAGSARDLVGFSLFPQRFALQLVGTFGVIGLILASIGIYGVLAYEVSRRTRELGVRRAIGATSAMLLRSVVRRGVVITAAGCAIGMVAGAALALLVRSFLFGIQPLDPVTFTVVPALLFVVAFLASWLPGLRASSVEPSEALRAD